MKKKISIIVISYNTRKLLRKCLESALKTCQGFEYEVLVFDNGSNDGSAEMIEMEFPNIHLEKSSKNVGFTIAVNRLLRHVSGDYVLFLHPDVELLPGTILQFVQFFDKNADVGILGGNLRYPDGIPNPCEIEIPGLKKGLLNFLCRVLARLFPELKNGRCYNSLLWSHEKTSQVNWVWHACMLARKEVFDNIGLFDEKFWVWYADTDLCKRAEVAGWKSYYLKEAPAIHHERQSFGKRDAIDNAVRYKTDGWYSAPLQIKDRFVFIKKHHSRLKVLDFKAFHLLENILRISVMWIQIFKEGFRKKESLTHLPFQIRACLRSTRNIIKA